MGEWKHETLVCLTAAPTVSRGDEETERNLGVGKITPSVPGNLPITLSLSLSFLIFDISPVDCPGFSPVW